MDIEKELLGKTLIRIENSDDELTFTTSEGSVYRLYHQQDCCENVYIEDICGDLHDLVGSPLVEIEEIGNADKPLTCKDNLRPTHEIDESYTWTFYKFRTAKGFVTVRWYGSSNGYYSESVDFRKIT